MPQTNDDRIVSQAGVKRGVGAMAMMSPECRPAAADATEPPASGLDRILRFMSVATMVMTLPQVYSVWFDDTPAGVSVLSWGAYLLSACLWFIYGLRRRDKTIYLACIGWILLDVAIIVGVIVRG
jgi:uncharacterized protein with PQ loop repeat